MKLYERAKDPAYMKEFGGAPLQTTQEQDKDIRRLNNLRTNFAHFTPKGWSIESVGLSRIVLNAALIIEILMLSHPACTLRLEQEQSARVEKAIATLRDLLPRAAG